MTTMTLRGIDETISGALKARAQQEASSVNTVMLKILKEALGLEKKKRTAEYHDLDYLAGTWSQQDAKAFEQATAVFESVDESLWK